MKSNKLVQHNLTGQHFGYSAASLDDLASPSYTLVTICCDESSSVSTYKTEIEKCIQEVVRACKFSQRSDYLLIRLVAFNSNMREIHGFKQLVDCDPNDYIGSISPSGMTALFSATQNSISATNDYAKQLDSEDYTDINSIVFIITDGEDNASGSVSVSDVGESLKSCIRDEYLESISAVLIGVGVGDYPSLSDTLNDFKTEAGLNQYIEIDNADDKSLAQLADFISKSVSATSNSLGTGNASTPLTF